MPAVSTAILSLSGWSQPLAANSAVQTTSTLDDVVVGVLGLEVLDQVIVLLVGLVGLFLEGDLLVRVGGIPLFDQGTDNVAVVLALDVGDGAAAVEALFGVAAASAARGAASATTGGKG